MIKVANGHVLQGGVFHGVKLQFVQPVVLKTDGAAVLVGGLQCYRSDQIIDAFGGMDDAVVDQLLVEGVFDDLLNVRKLGGGDVGEQKVVLRGLVGDQPAFFAGFIKKGGVPFAEGRGLVDFTAGDGFFDLLFELFGNVDDGGVDSY